MYSGPVEDREDCARFIRIELTASGAAALIGVWPETALHGDGVQILPAGA